MDTKARILVVDDEENVLLTISTILADRGYEVVTAGGGQEAIERIEKETFDVVLTDLAMKDCDGLQVLRAVREHQHDAISIMLTGYASLDSALEAIRRGAYDYLTKPTNIEELLQTVARGIEKRRLQLELKRRVDELATLNRLASVGVDGVLRSTRDVGKALERVAEIVSEVLAPRGAVMILGGDPPAEARARFARVEEAGRLIDGAAARALAAEAARSGEPRQERLAGTQYAALAVPVEWQRKRLGALLVCDRAARAFTVEQVETAATIAGRVALAIENAALYREVLEEKETLGLILDATGDGIAGLDGEGRIVFFSRALQRLTGIAEAEVRGRPFETIVAAHPSADPFAAIRARAATAPNGLASGNIVLNVASAGEIFCEVLCSHLGEGETGQVRTVVAVRDARERRRVEEAKTLALSHFTHELKTPLTSILAYAHLLAADKLGALTERQHEALRVMRRNGDQLLSLIENMLIAVQITQGSVRYRFEAVPLSAILADARECFAPIANERSLELVVHEEADAEIFADKDILARAVNNLLSNALRFTDAGGRVTLRTRDLGQEVAIEVCDTGIGIPEEYHGRIFQRFFQVDGSRGGSGLGLSIVKSIVEAHAGRVTLESGTGRGARFTITLPKRGAGAEEAPASQAITASRGAGG